jgi:hypothetical protein
MLAWFVDMRFLIAALGMWLSGLLTVRLMDGFFLIYGTAWFVGLQVIGWRLHCRPARTVVRLQGPGGD